MEPGILPGSLEGGDDQDFARIHKCPRSGLRIDAASCGSVEPGILPGSLEGGYAHAFARMTAVSAFNLRIDAASCGSLEPGIHARLP